MQSDFAEAERSGIDADIASGVNGDPEQTIAFWHTWMAGGAGVSASRPALGAGRLIVAGTCASPPPDGTVAVAGWQHEPEEA